MGDSMANGSAFIGPAEEHDFAALLFDMDGTIIDSTDAIVKYWHMVGDEIGVPGEEILQTSHGVRSIDVIARYAPHLATWAFVAQREGQVPEKFGQDAVEVPGSRALLAALERAAAPWAIVTSGTRPLVSGWLDVLRLAHPSVLVTAEEVRRGKPDPACYRLGAERLGLGDGDGDDRRRILVLEDAPAGVRAGKAAGFDVVGLATSHTLDQLRAAGADWIVEDMRSVTLVSYDAARRAIRIRLDRLLVSS